MPEYIIHIGPHKTGTTYLQARFKQLRADLLRRGIYYPDQWERSSDDASHQQLVTMIGSRDPDLTEQFRELSNSDYTYVLLSSEDLSDLDADDIEHLRLLLGDSPASVIFYCRNWSSLISSIFQEHIKQGYTITLPAYFGDIAADPSISGPINFSLTLRLYASVFGKPSIRLVSYTELVDRKVDLAQHFFDTFLQWPAPLPIAERRVNVSLDPVDVEIIRALNGIDWNRRHVRGVDMRDAFLGHKHELAIEPLMANMRLYFSQIEMNESAPHFDQLHRAIAGEFGSSMGDPLPSGYLFTPRDATLDYISHEYLFDDGTLSTLLGIHDALTA